MSSPTEAAPAQPAVADGGKNLPAVELISGGIRGVGEVGEERYISHLALVKETGALAVAVVDHETTKLGGEITAVAVPGETSEAEGETQVDFSISPTFTRNALTHPNEAMAVEVMTLRTLAQKELIPSPDGSGEERILVNVKGPDAYVDDPHSAANHEGDDPQRTMDVRTLVAHTALENMPNVVVQLAPKPAAAPTQERPPLAVAA